MSAGTTTVEPFCVGIKGVRVTCDGRNGYLVMSPENDGHIRVLDSAKEVEIKIKIEKGINVWGFNVYGKGDITPAHNYSKAGRVYRKKVPIRIPIHKNKSHTLSITKTT